MTFMLGYPLPGDNSPDESSRLFDLRRARKRAVWQERRDELRQLRKAREAERGRERVRIEKKRHEREYKRRAGRENHLRRRQREAPPPELSPVVPHGNDPVFLLLLLLRRQALVRRRRMRRAMGRPPLRELPVRKPTREELLANALAALRERGAPNRNLVRLVRWFYGDLGDSTLSENIQAKHRRAAGEVIRKTERDLSSFFRRDSISCRRTLRRGRIIARNRNYRWTRFPAAGLDNFGLPAALPAKVYNPFLGLESIHPRLVGFAAAEGFPERLKMVRRIVGLENVFGPEEVRGAAASPACLRNDSNDGLRNDFSDSVNDGLGDAVKNAGRLPALRPLRRGFVFSPPAVRRRFVPPAGAAGPPALLFPGSGRKEVLLCLPGGGLRGCVDFAATSPRCASGLIAA